MEQKVLRLLMDGQGYVSGEAISRALGVTRAAVWKAVAALRTAGYEIEAVTRRGYRLIAAPDAMTEAAVGASLTTRAVGRVMHFDDAVDSTNLAAKRAAEEGAPHGAVFVAESQTAGRGRLGRGWISPPGTGVFASILLRPDLPPAHIVHITLAAGLAVSRAIQSLCGLRAGIKWPNDLVVNGKKVCGILTEMSAEAESISALVCGIGINANNAEFPPELRDAATSLALESGARVDRSVLLARVLSSFEEVYDAFIAEGVETLLPDYKARCITLGRAVRATGREGAIIGTAVDVTCGGDLVVETPGGMVTVCAGEVSVRGVMGYV